MASKKNAPKDLILNPTRSISGSPASCSVEMNSAGTAYVLTLKVLVGQTEMKKSKKGTTYYQSGVLVVDKPIDIGGVMHQIRLNSGWYNNKKVGDAEIVIAPYIPKEDTSSEVQGGDDDFK